MRLFYTLLVVFVFLTSGCAKCTDCGQIRRSDDVTTMFNSVTISPEYKYYTFEEGTVRPPYAILGIEKKYDVRTSFWKESDFSEEKLSAWIREYRIEKDKFDDFYRVPTLFRGYNVLDPNGNQVGVYYSTLEWTTFKFLPGNVIELGRPQPSVSQQALRGYGRRDD